MIDWKKEFVETAREREKFLNLFCDLSNKYGHLEDEYKRTKEELERAKMYLEHAKRVINDLYGTLSR